ncbi:MAG: hypothetical protein R6U31_01045 [bacterium]
MNMTLYSAFGIITAILLIIIIILIRRRREVSENKYYEIIVKLFSGRNVDIKSIEKLIDYERDNIFNYILKGFAYYNAGQYNKSYNMFITISANKSLPKSINNDIKYLTALNLYHMGKYAQAMEITESLFGVFKRPDNEEKILHYKLEILTGNYFNIAMLSELSGRKEMQSFILDVYRKQGDIKLLEFAIGEGFNDSSLVYPYIDYYKHKSNYKPLMDLLMKHTGDKIYSQNVFIQLFEWIKTLNEPMETVNRISSGNLNRLTLNVLMLFADFADQRDDRRVRVLLEELRKHHKDSVRKHSGVIREALLLTHNEKYLPLFREEK